MTSAVTLTGDTKKLERHLSRLNKSAVNTVAVQSVNQHAKNIRKEAIKAVSQELKLPQKVIRNRIGLDGQVTGPRTQYFKATRANKTALLRVHHRGIPVAVVKGAKTRRGIKAKGGRLYTKAFIPPSGPKMGLVLQRRKESRYPLFVPKIPVRAQLKGAYEKRIFGPRGRRNFEIIYNQKLRKKIATIRA